MTRPPTTPRPVTFRPAPPARPPRNRPHGDRRPPRCHHPRRSRRPGHRRQRRPVGARGPHLRHQPTPGRRPPQRAMWNRAVPALVTVALSKVARRIPARRLRSPATVRHRIRRPGPPVRTLDLPPGHNRPAPTTSIGRGRRPDEPGIDACASPERVSFAPQLEAHRRCPYVSMCRFGEYFSLYGRTCFRVCCQFSGNLICDSHHGKG
jgi:hypothetical protein